MKRTTHSVIKYALFFLILFFFSFNGSVQAQYTYNLGGAGFDKGVEAGVDAAGNAYFIGQFNDSLDFDPGPDVHRLGNLNTDVFVASYDPAGDMRFAFKISGNAASHEGAGDIAVAPSGSFVVTGSQPFGFIDFDPDPIEETVRTGELFIAGYTSEGKIRFAVSPNGGENTSSGYGFAVTLDEEENVYVTGSFATSLDFNPPDTSNGVVPNAGVNDVFIASYTSTGQYRYAYGFGGASFDHGSDIVVDSEHNVYVAGMFSGEVYFDPQDADQDGDQVQRTSENTTDIFLASFDDAGRLRFVYTYKGTSSIDTSRKIALSIDGADNIYMSGQTHGTVPFDPEDSDGDGNLRERTAEGLGSAFIASYTSEGKYRYASVFKGGSSWSEDVFVNQDGIGFITGGCSGSVDFDPGVNDGFLSTSRGADVFVASYDSTGAYRLAFNLPSTGISGGAGIAVDADYNIVLTGGFSNELDVAYGTLEDMRTSSGQNDIFMSRYEAAGAVRVGVESVDGLPTGFDVSPLYPNPFAASTTVTLEMKDSREVRVTVFDLLGREVGQLHEGRLPAGQHRFVWHAGAARDGVYFIRVEYGEASKVMRAVLVR